MQFAAKMANKDKEPTPCTVLKTRISKVHAPTTAHHCPPLPTTAHSTSASTSTSPLHQRLFPSQAGRCYVS